MLLCQLPSRSVLHNADYRFLKAIKAITNHVVCLHFRNKALCCHSKTSCSKLSVWAVVVHKGQEERTQFFNGIISVETGFEEGMFGAQQGVVVMFMCSIHKRCGFVDDDRLELG